MIVEICCCRLCIFGSCRCTLNWLGRCFKLYWHRGFTRRLLGDVAISFVCQTHRDATRANTFEPVTPTPLCDSDSNVVQLVPERGVILPINVAIGLSDDALSLEYAEQDDAFQALPRTARTTPLRTLETQGPDGAATQVGNYFFTALTRLYPGVFSRYPKRRYARLELPAWG